MNDKRILDDMVEQLEAGYLGDFHGEDIKFDPFIWKFGRDPEPSDKEIWREITNKVVVWIKAERAEEALDQKIRAEVKKQIGRMR